MDDRTLSGCLPVPDCNFIEHAWTEYRNYVDMEHGSLINPITGEEVDIMNQCVNLQLSAGSNTDMGDKTSYSAVITDFVEHLVQGTIAWLALDNNSRYQKGQINRVNSEDLSAVTYDFQYTKRVIERGKEVDKTFVVKDCTRRQIKTRQLLVKGDPAGGKTTFAKQLMTWIMRREETNWLVPVMVRTIDLVRFSRSFVAGDGDMVDQYLAMNYAENGFYHLFYQARMQGRLLIILDGFDEAGKLEMALTRQIRDILNNECFLILTSRDMGKKFDHVDFERFRTVRVMELSAEQQRQVIERRLDDKDRVEKFCTQLTLNPSLSHMAKNPLLLNVSLAVFESCELEHSMELNRGKIYSFAFDGMLGTIEKAKALADDTSTGELHVTAKILRMVLRRIAYLAHTQDHGSGIRDFKRPLIQRAIETSGVGTEFTMEHWQGVEDIIKKGRLPVLAWLVEHGQDTFRFAHLTFQEFLCAEQCLEYSLKDEDFILEWRELVCPDSNEQIIRRGWWQQTLQMYCDLAISCGAKSKAGNSLATALGEHFLRLTEDTGADLELHQGMDDSNVLTIVSMLSNNTTLETMLLGKDVSSKGISALQSLKLTSLQRLSLQGNQIGPDGCKVIASFIEFGGAPLRILDLSNNIICQGDAKSEMPPESQRNPSTGHYNSYAQDLQGFGELLRAVQACQTLRHVDFRGNFLDLEAGKMLSKMVSRVGDFEEVCGIPVRRLREEGVDELIYANNAFFISGPRRTLNPEPFFATGDAELLFDLLLMYPQAGLTKLCLDNQALASDQGGVVPLFEKLGDVVATAERLEVLSLHGFWDCGAAAGKVLGQKIKSHSILKTIDIGTGTLDFEALRLQALSGEDEVVSLKGSGIRDCGAGILSGCMPSNVRKLDIRGCGVGATGYKTLSACVHLEDINGIQLQAFTDTCTSLDFSKEPPNSSGAVACVLARTRQTPNLTHLNLSWANLTSKSHVHTLTPVIGGYGSISCDGGCDHSRFEGSNAYMNCAKCDLDICSTCCMSECPMIALAEALDNLPLLVSLKIPNCAFHGGRHGPIRSHKDEEGYRVLGTALSKHRNLSDLDISSNLFQCPGFPYLAKGIAKMPALKTLTVRNSTVDFLEWLSQETIKPREEWAEAELLIMSNAIKRNSNLRHLDLTEAKRLLTDPVVQALVESLRGNCDVDTDVDAPTSSSADASCNDRGSPLPILSAMKLDTLVLDSAVLPFSKVQSGTISCLDLSTETLVRRESLAPLFALIVDAGKSLTEIDFSYQDFGKASPHIVSTIVALACNDGLKRYNTVDLQPSRESNSLNLERKPVMPHGICVIAATTIPNGNIAELNLVQCGMDASSLGVLLNALLGKQTVTSLDISYNTLGRAGTHELAHFLRADRKLQVLRARSIAMPEVDTSESLGFANALDTNLTLATLDLRENILAESVVDRLRRNMEEKRSVVPLPTDCKHCFLLCNKRLPRHLRLPEVFCSDVSTFYLAQSPLVLVFQYCAQARELLLDV